MNIYIEVIILFILLFVFVGWRVWFVFTRWRLKRKYHPKLNISRRSEEYGEQRTDIRTDEGGESESPDTFVGDAGFN
jgi:hypothetical protein